MRLIFCLACFFAFPASAKLAMADAPADSEGSRSESAAANQLTESEKLSGWKLLFDGESTDLWRNYNSAGVADGWKVIDGALVRSSDGAGDLITTEKFDSFDLSLQYKISSGGNSGLMFHVIETDQPSYHTGPEIQIYDNDAAGSQKSGWLYELYRSSPVRWAEDQTPIDATRPAGQWNEIYLRVAPSGGVVCVNGVHYYNFTVGDDNWNRRVANSKFAGFADFAKSGDGHLCLQDHGDEVAFRNIKVRRLGEGESVPEPIHGELDLTSELAFPHLQWDQWDAVDDAGQIRPLRLIELTYANDDSNRLYAVSQVGAIWTFENNPDVSQSKLFLDLRGKVHDWKRSGANEQGLLGFAMHPDYKDNGKFYVYYSHPSEKKSVLSCFTRSSSDPNRADPDSEKILMQIAQPFQNHNGGSIEFGPDGYLYIGLGDGGYRNDPLQAGQDLSNILGKILRIDVNRQSPDRPYAIPSDNPFVDQSEARAEIYALGLRNPWRIAFDKQSGRLWCGDVGQELWEEVNVITKGGNYGWSYREGTHPFGNQNANAQQTELIGPVWEYDHGIGKSITGGRVYHSGAADALKGKYLYADYVTGTIWALSYDPKTGKAIRNERVLPDSIPVLAFGETPAGEVFYLTNSVRGECIYRFKPKP